jgi:hypothetical protein
MDKNADSMQKELDSMFGQFGRRKSASVEGSLTQLLSREGYKSFEQQQMTDVREEGMKKQIGFPPKKGKA